MTILEAGRCTPREFAIYSKAYKVKQIEENLRLAKQSWFNQSVQSVDKNGKSIYKRFEDFFDFEKAMQDVFEDNKSNKPKLTIADLNLAMSKKRKEE